MNVLLALLVACAAMLAAMWELNRRSVKQLPTLEQYEFYLSLNPDHYRYLSRLFAPEDFQFLKRMSSGRALLPRLRRERRRLLRLLLADLRHDFEALVAVGSLLSLSVTGKEDGYAQALAGQSLRFYASYFAFKLISYWPGPWPVPGGPVPLWQQIQALRHSTETLMRSLTPHDVVQLRQTFGVEQKG